MWHRSSPGGKSCSNREVPVGITLTCDITGDITGNAGVREWPIGICGHEQGSLK